MPLTFVLVYRKDAMFAHIIGKFVIIFNNNLIGVSVVRVTSVL